jgi:hypothetical protein
MAGITDPGYSDAKQELAKNGGLESAAPWSRIPAKKLLVSRKTADRIPR